jgi:cytochrome d ubiquinol oxidase subunit II
VAFEYRSKHDNPRWRNLWDGCIFAGSLIPTILFPIAFANILRGVPIDANMQYVGGLFTLLNPYALLAALVVTLLFIFHGASFLSIKTTGEVEQAAKEYIRWLWLLVALLLVIFMVTTAVITNLLDRINFLTVILPVISVAAVFASGYFSRKQQFRRIFVMTCLTIAFLVLTIFILLYPNVMVSSLNPAWSLTIQNASSSPYTLKIMTIVALVFLPIVLIYQGWTYWIFRKRVSSEPKQLTY